MPPRVYAVSPQASATIDTALRVDGGVLSTRSPDPYQTIAGQYLE
jgi:hypothetical protein